MCNCKCGSKCDCKDKCECLKKLVKPCCYLKDIISAEKTVLNSAFLLEGGPISDPDFCATFEIVICNLTGNKIKNLSIVDSLMGLHGQVLASSSYGGELRPHFTNVEIIGSANLVANNFDAIVSSEGELLDTTVSYLNPCECAVLQIRLTGRGFLVANDPVDNAPEGPVAKYTSLMQNTAVIRGDVVVNGSETVPMYPVYIKSGIISGFGSTVFTFFGGP